jgi:type II secretory pathway component PulF
MTTVTAALVTRPVSLDQLAALSDEIAALARAGVPLDRGLKALAAEMPGRVGQMADKIGDGLAAGQPLDAMIGSLGSRLPAAYRHVLLSGLRAGRLPMALESVARTARRVSELRRAIGLALMYPLIVLSLTWVLGLFVVVQIAPVMVAMLTEFDVTSPAVHSAFDKIVSTLPIWGAFIPLVFAAYMAWVWYASGRASLGFELHPLFSFGALGTLARMQRASRHASLAELLSLLVTNDIPLPDAVRLASSSLGSPRIAAGGAALADRLSRGEPIHDAPPGFPPLLAWMLAAGHSKEHLVRSLARTAEVYRDEVTRRSQWLAVYAPLMLTIVVAGSAVLLYAALTLGPWLAIMRRLTMPYSVFF